MSRVLITIALLLTSFSSFSAIQLSDSAKISLLTCAPGQELYSLYGHSALRVKDDTQAMDLVFNYGTFDFNTPNFYLKFANGNLKYLLAVGRFNSFLQSYFNDGRSVWEQELNLKQHEKQQLFDALANNAKTENRYYRYDFFFDNCATRIRDIVYDNMDGEISYVDTTETIRSFRSYIHEYEKNMPWVKEGLDIILGLGTDHKAYVNEQMFLPDYMMLYFGKAIINKEGEESRSLVKEMRPLLRFELDDTKPSLMTPTLVFGLILLLGALLTTYELKFKKKPIMVFNRLLFLTTGIVGFLIVFLWFFTRHGVTGNNFNILWANPLYILMAFVPIKYMKKGWIKIIMISLLLSLVSLLLLWFVLPQNLPSMVAPLTLLLIIRLGYLFKYIKH